MNILDMWLGKLGKFLEHFYLDDLYNHLSPDSQESDLTEAKRGYQSTTFPSVRACLL